MFWKKKPVDASTFQDRMCNKMFSNIQSLIFDLYAQAEKTITKSGVVDLYPEGADKEVAKEVFAAARYRLRYLIGALDTARAEYIRYCEENKDSFVTTRSSKWVFVHTSHDIVEQVYQNYYRRN